MSDLRQQVSDHIDRLQPGYRLTLDAWAIAIAEGRREEAARLHLTALTMIAEACADKGWWH
jgi:hypothetical protein